METSAFRALLAQLDSLTSVQRKALAEVLAFDGSSGEASALDLPRFSGGTKPVIPPRKSRKHRCRYDKTL